MSAEDLVHYVGKYVTWTQPKESYDGRKWTPLPLAISTVKLMSFAQGYAMVRRKGCTPFVVQLKELSP